MSSTKRIIDCNIPLIPDELKGATLRQGVHHSLQVHQGKFTWRLGEIKLLFPGGKSKLRYFNFSSVSGYVRQRGRLPLHVNVLDYLLIPESNILIPKGAFGRKIVFPDTIYVRNNIRYMRYLSAYEYSDKVYGGVLELHGCYRTPLCVLCI